MRAALYTRTSAADLDAGVTSAGLLAELREYAAGRAWKVTAELADRGPGILGRREALAKLLELVKDRKVDVVVTTSLARLCRSLSHVIDVANLLQANPRTGVVEVALVASKEDVDTTTPGGRARWLDAVDLFRTIRGAQRTEAVKLARMKRTDNRSSGRPAAVINPLELAGYWQGTRSTRPLSVKEIARKLGYSQATIRVRLKALLDAGKLDPELRERHLAAAGGLRKGGRPSLRRIDLVDLGLRWNAGQSKQELRRTYRCGVGRLKAKLAEARAQGRLDDELRATNLEKRRRR